MTAIVVTRMWPGGPLRQMAESKVSGTFIPVTPRQNLTSAGRYVCDGCQEPSKGVYRQDDSKMSGNGHSSDVSGWFCDSCRQGKARVTRTPEQREARRAALAERLTVARQIALYVNVVQRNGILGEGAEQKVTMSQTQMLCEYGEICPRATLPLIPVWVAVAVLWASVALREKTGFDACLFGAEVPRSVSICSLCLMCRTSAYAHSEYMLSSATYADVRIYPLPIDSRAASPAQSPGKLTHEKPNLPTYLYITSVGNCTSI